MQPGDWFAIDQCPPQRMAAIRAAVTNHRKTYPTQHFTVRYLPDLGPATAVCARLA